MESPTLELDKLVTLAHVVQSVSKTNTYMFLRTKTRPLMHSLQKRCYGRDSHDCSNPLSQTLHSPFCHRSCFWLKRCDAQTQNVIHHCHSCNIPPCPIRYANPHPSISCKKTTCQQSPTLGAHAHAHPCPWVLGGHGCDIIGNVTIFEYMGAI